MCSHSTFDSDVQQGNIKFSSSLLEDVASLSWKKVKDYVIKGEESNDVYVVEIRRLEERDKAAKVLRDCNTNSCQ